jgi:hypothetical protein
VSLGKGRSIIRPPLGSPLALAEGLRAPLLVLVLLLLLPSPPLLLPSLLPLAQLLLLLLLAGRCTPLLLAPLRGSAPAAAAAGDAWLLLDWELATTAGC